MHADSGSHSESQAFLQQVLRDSKQNFQILLGIVERAACMGSQSEGHVERSQDLQSAEQWMGGLVYDAGGALCMTFV
jgi:hypothetical protein